MSYEIKLTLLVLVLVLVYTIFCLIMRIGAYLDDKRNHLHSYKE